VGPKVRKDPKDIPDHLAGPALRVIQDLQALWPATLAVKEVSGLLDIPDPEEQLDLQAVKELDM
jgi:hypothetical protein